MIYRCLRANSYRLITLGLIGIVVYLAGSPVWADRARAIRLVEQARAFMRDDKYEQAREKLAEAIKADARYPEIYANLGYIDELTATKEQALEHYGHTLTLKPEHAYARSRFRRLFFTDRFPRRIELRYLKYSPVSLVVDSCQVTLADASGSAHPYTRRFAYTTSLLFPEEMDRGAPALQIEIPAAGEGSGVTSVVNRAAYGLVMTPDSDILHLRFVVQYPSVTISSAQKDYAQLAQLLTHMLLRFSLYSEIYLGRVPPGDEEGLVRVYLCEAGPTGAEQYEDNIYLYDVDEDRTPLEWAREVAHELGHYLLPRVGRLEEPEPWGNGELGERLFLQWLAAEAGEVTGERWPSEAAQAALTSLCNGQPMDLESYIQNRCRPLLDFWLQQGPESPLIAGANQPSLDYFIGFCLWVQAAHGPALLAKMLDATTGSSIAEFREAYQATVRQILAERPLAVNAGALNLVNSQLSHPLQEGATGREAVKIERDDAAVLPVFVPAGAWQVRVDCQPEDAGLRVAAEVGEETIEGIGEISLAVGQAGWHRIRITAPQTAQVILLKGITVTAVRQVLAQIDGR